MKLIKKYISCLLLFVVTNVISNDSISDSTITIEASLYENASFQGNWNIKIIEFSDSSGAELEFSNNTGVRGGSFAGSSLIQKDSLLLIRTTIDKQEYFELSEFIAPEFLGLDMPDYRLKICEDDKCHKVRLYQPKRIPKSEEMKRFVNVWNAVMSEMPKWPSSWPEYKIKNIKNNVQ